LVKASGSRLYAGGVAPFVSWVCEVLFVATAAIVAGFVIDTFIFKVQRNSVSPSFRNSEEFL
jgi:hypothetical protein